jgi:RNA-directed DNA polymerase
MTYYGRYYRTALDGLLRRINAYLMRWARREVQEAAAIQESPEVVA